jgi:hypothetical protein
MRPAGKIGRRRGWGAGSLARMRPQGFTLDAESLVHHGRALLPLAGPSASAARVPARRSPERAGRLLSGGALSVPVVLVALGVVATAVAIGWWRTREPATSPTSVSQSPPGAIAMLSPGPPSNIARRPAALLPPAARLAVTQLPPASRKPSGRVLDCSRPPLAGATLRTVGPTRVRATSKGDRPLRLDLQP